MTGRLDLAIKDGAHRAGGMRDAGLARALRAGALSLTVLIGVAAGGLAGCAQAQADDNPQVATAVTQDLFEPVPGLSIRWHGKLVSALPFRIRLLDQASPLAYSLDISRPVAYGDSWTGVSLGQATNPADRSQSSIGVIDPLIAEAVARGDASVNKPIVPAGSPEELAARQIAIWAATNAIALTARTVPNAALRRRAHQLLTGATGVTVPLQAADHSVQIFVQGTTANTVQLAVSIGLDPNTQLTTLQTIDLYLNGVSCSIRTRAVTSISRRSDGTYYATKPQPTAPQSHSTGIAEVNLQRNTEVVAATATWVNVVSDPGLVMVSAGAAPPLVTAEPAVLNFTSSAQLNPSDYAGPQQLLDNAGIAFLTTLPGWADWVFLVLALYLISRVGRVVDLTGGAIVRRARARSGRAPQLGVSLATVEVEATTEREAIRVGLQVLNLTTPADVKIQILQASKKKKLAGAASPALVRLTRRVRQGS